MSNAFGLIMCLYCDQSLLAVAHYPNLLMSGEIWDVAPGTLSHRRQLIVSTPECVIVFISPGSVYFVRQLWGCRVPCAGMSFLGGQPYPEISRRPHSL